MAQVFILFAADAGVGVLVPIPDVWLTYDVAVKGGHFSGARIIERLLT